MSAVKDKVNEDKVRLRDKHCRWVLIPDSAGSKAFRQSHDEFERRRRVDFLSGVLVKPEEIA